MKSKIVVVFFLWSSAFFCSCNNWLDVTSETEIVSDEQFSHANGFRDALIGIYVKLAKPELYSMHMTWRTVEFLSQQYAVVSLAPDVDVPKYLYNSEPLVGYNKSLWINMYYVIANINNALLNESKTGHVMHPVMDSIVKGELLALRAFVHFDLLRLYGKGNYGQRPDLAGQYTIPYVTQFIKDPTAQPTYAVFLEKLKHDIAEAVKYLEADPQKSEFDRPEGYYNSVINDEFITLTKAKRRLRMNYYAAMALQARILMWEGTPESKAKALTIANEVITRSALPATKPAFSWTKAADLAPNEWWLRNNIFVDEHLWTLHVENFSSIAGSWFEADSPNSRYRVVYLTSQRTNEIFEVPGIGESDWRYTRGLIGEGADNANMSIVKIRPHEARRAASKNRLPLIRGTELYYIAAECCLEEGADYNPQKAMDYLNIVRENRNISTSKNLDASQMTIDEMRNEIKKEYMKEFVGEGQLFFYYKRTGQKRISGYANEMTDLEYVFPMPDDELINGNRTQMN